MLYVRDGVVDAHERRRARVTRPFLIRLPKGNNSLKIPPHFRSNCAAFDPIAPHFVDVARRPGGGAGNTRTRHSHAVSSETHGTSVLIRAP